MEERAGTFTVGTRRLSRTAKLNVLKGSSAANVRIDATAG
jgi:hypothetical protein